MTQRMTADIACKGHVLFPVESTDYTNTHEGGMFVRLVVEDVSDPGGGRSQFMACIGGRNYVLWDEEFIGSDRSRTYEELVNEIKDFFPWMDDRENCIGDPDMSVGCMAVLTLGSTNWSGFKENDGYWLCRYADLSDFGKQIYDSMQQAYPEAKLTLQTWLDT